MLTKVFVDGPEYETLGGIGTNLGIFDRPFMLELNFHCDTMDWYDFVWAFDGVCEECYEAGILDSKKMRSRFSWGKADDCAWGRPPMDAWRNLVMIVVRFRAMKKYFAENLCGTQAIPWRYWDGSKRAGVSENLTKIVDTAMRYAKQ